jgi:hypothetical protein
METIEEYFVIMGLLLEDIPQWNEKSGFVCLAA